MHACKCMHAPHCIRVCGATLSAPAWTLSGALPTGSTLTAIVEGGRGDLLAVGDGNTILYNAAGDAKTWENVRTPVASHDQLDTIYFHGATYSPSADAFFLACSASRILKCVLAGTLTCALVYTSPDASNNPTIISVFAPNTTALSIVLASSSEGALLTSSDGGGTWTARTTPSSFEIDDVAWVESEAFFAAAGASSRSPEAISAAAILQSADGISWTVLGASADHPEWNCNDDFKSIAVSDLLHAVLATACSTNEAAFTVVYMDFSKPPDQRAFLVIPLQNTLPWIKVSWIPVQARFWLLQQGARMGEYNFADSGDGFSRWSFSEGPKTRGGVSSFALFQGGNSAIAVGTAGGMWTSPVAEYAPLFKWHTVNKALPCLEYYDNSIDALFYSSACPADEGPTGLYALSGSCLLRSGDGGSSWTALPGLSEYVLLGAAGCGNGVMIGLSKTILQPNQFAIYYRQDHTSNWTQLIFGQNITREMFMLPFTYDVVYGAGTFLVSVGNVTMPMDKSAFLMVSTDGLNWNRQEYIKDTGTYSLQTLEYLGGMFFGMIPRPDVFRVFKSADGTRWTSVPLQTFPAQDIFNFAPVIVAAR
jgi:hypothetical protein